MSTPYSGFGFDMGHLVANADMDSKQWYFVTTGSVAGEFKVGTGASGPVPLGVLQNDPRQGEPGVIRVLGTSKITASDAIGYGDFVICGSHGKAIVQASASAGAQGIALQALASGGGVIEILLLPNALTSADNTP